MRIQNFIPSYDYRTGRSEGVTGFGSEPLAIMTLKMALTYIVAAGVSENILVSFGLRNSLASPSNDDDQLDLVVQGRAIRRADNIVPWTNEACRKLREYYRLLWKF